MNYLQTWLTSVFFMNQQNFAAMDQQIIRWMVEGKSLSEIETELKSSAPHSQSEMKKSRGLAVVPFTGAMFLESNFYTRYGYGIDSHQYDKTCSELEGDDDIDSVIFRVACPGGEALATAPFNSITARLAEKKNVIAFNAQLMTSAAVGAFASADHIYSDPMALFGNVGAKINHFSFQSYYEAFGIKQTIVESAPYKAAVSDMDLSERGLEQLQSIVDDSHEQFVDLLSETLPLARSKVEEFASGFIWTGSQAAKENVIVEKALSFEELLRSEGVANKTKNASNTRSNSSPPFSKSVDDPPLQDKQERKDYDMSTEKNEVGELTLTSLKARRPDLFQEVSDAAKLETRAALEKDLGLEPGKLDQKTIETMKQEAADGKGYRADLLTSLHELHVKLEGATPDKEGKVSCESGDRARAVFAKADIKHVKGEVDRLSTMLETAIPGRRSNDDEPEATNESAQAQVAKNRRAAAAASI